MLAAERDVSPADRAAIRTRLEASVGVAPRGGGGLAAGKLIALGGALLLVAAGLWWQLGRSPSASAPVVAPAPIESAPADEPSRIAQLEQAPVAETAAEQPARKPRAAEPSQAELLAKAWQSLAKGDAAATLGIVDEDLRLHPAGPLTEERDAIRIKALAAAGRMDEARELARTFLAQFPASVHRKAARQLVGEAP
jgi:hypothetical protein